MSHYIVYTTEKYENEAGDEQTAYHRVGRLVAHNNGEGFGLYIAPGISVRGQMVCFPPKDKNGENAEGHNEA